MRIDDKNANYATFNAGITSGYTSETTRSADGATVLTFTAESEQLRVSKQYTITEGSYEIPMSIAVTNLGSTALSVPMNVQIGSGLGEGFDKASYVFAGPIIGNKEDNEKKLPEKVKDPIVLANPQWGAYTSKYFLFAFMSDAFDNAQIVKQDASAVTQLNGTLTVPAGESSSLSDAKLFVGPKYYNPLNAYDIGIQKTIDYGIFFFLGIPMARLMNFFYSFVNNYGIAIIFLTIIVKLITLPLTLKSMKSMKAMSRMQPEVMALREKYKGDPQRMNAATMELYKKHGANPVSGCLPMLIQLPVFVALYNALLVSIELRGAPFFGWITDLSLKDPYYITPIIMGASMFITQKMTPTTADPTQQKIMLIMPIVFTFMFLNFPAGLVVYWLTNNILSIVQQFIINKQTPKPAVAAK
jgi:YidC/Oxa1 family membrane protein insertase